MTDTSTTLRSNTEEFGRFRLEDCVRHRHSIRFYKPDPVPENLLYECLSLAQLAPSNSNIQPWRLTFATGPARDRVVSALKAAAQAQGPQVPPLPEKFKHFRSQFGHLLYGEEGYNISRDDNDTLQAARLRNFGYFGAPVVGGITMDDVLTQVDAMSVGLFVQTFILALTERGLGSCLQVSVTGFPEILRREFALPDHEMILCGVAVGWPAEHNRVNELVVPRQGLEQTVRVLRE